MKNYHLINLFPKVLLLLVVFNLISCSFIGNEENENFKMFEKYIYENLFKQNKNNFRNIVLFIPVEGCEECVEKSVIFMKKHPQKNAYVIMAARKNHMNSFRDKFGLNKILQLNAYYDTEKPLKSGVYSGFPYILHVDEEKKVIKRISLNALNIVEELSKIE